MKRIIKHQQITQTFQKAHCSSSAVLCLIAGKILRRRVVTRIASLNDRRRLDLAYRLRAFRHRVNSLVALLSQNSFASFELSFYYMHAQNPHVN